VPTAGLLTFLEMKGVSLCVLIKHLAVNSCMWKGKYEALRSLNFDTTQKTRKEVSLVDPVHMSFEF
jgi:hypothetical protein